MKKLRILITGSNGLLGQKIISGYKSDPGLELIATARGENRMKNQEGYTYATLDITNRQDVFDVLSEFQPDCVIHTAAMTDVDACERDSDMCELLNVTATQHLADACSEMGIHLIHLSTDFIFDGTNGPYAEDDKPNPLSVYGHSKWRAEKIVKQLNSPWAIVRTVLVVGITEGMSRSNIVLWAKNALERGQPINVVSDQYRTPTLAEDLAQGCILVARKKATGIYNISGKDFMSIYELVHHVAAHWHLDHELINEVDSSILSQPAKRPLITGFILEKAYEQLGYEPHSFKEVLQIIEKQIKTHEG